MTFYAKKDTNNSRKISWCLFMFSGKIWLLDQVLGEHYIESCGAL